MIKDIDHCQSLGRIPGAGTDKLASKTNPANVYGQKALNKGKERINKCHLKKDIHDYVT